jgi:transposase
MRASLEERRLMGKLVRQGNSISFVAELLGFDRKTVSYWSKQDWRSVKNLKKDREGKISVEAEVSILYMGITFEWETARIQQEFSKD